MMKAQFKQTFYKDISFYFWLVLIIYDIHWFVTTSSRLELIIASAFLITSIIGLLTTLIKISNPHQ
jgi:hypothetical protein